MNRTFKKGGIHPPQYKSDANCEIVDVELPMEVTLTLNQHIGAPAVPIVGPGDVVKRGDMVGAPKAFMSVPVHTPISGVVKTVTTVRNAVGKPATTIVVKASPDEHFADIEAPKPQAKPRGEVLQMSVEQIRDAVRLAGVVGLGGAAFPTHVKLSPPTDAPIDTLVVNGAECEPFLTCDQALMYSQASHIMLGIEQAMKACGARRALVGIEDNKPRAIERMMQASSEYDFIEVVTLQTKYPQGGEKQLIEALTGRVVPTGALPSAVGVVVMNVATAHAVFRAVYFGEPLMERVLTIANSEHTAGNYRVAVGMKISDLMATLKDRLDQGTYRGYSMVISGGPMMGRALANLDAPVLKNTSGIVMLNSYIIERPNEGPCVRCARCVGVCPMGLEPYLLAAHARMRNFEEASDLGVMNCVECGSCQYVCPAGRRLVDYLRVGKAGARMIMKK